MSLENSIKDCISKELEKGIIEKVISEKLEECISSSIKDMFSWNGTVKAVIEDKIKSVMVPHLEKYDYSEYITKLDSVMVEVLKNTSLDNRNILNNFKELMTVEERKMIKITELFDKWTEYVAKNVKTEDLEINYDDGVSYESVEVTFEVEEGENRSWSIYESANLIFECEHDESLNFQIELKRWKDSKDKLWDIEYKTKYDISSLRYLNDFEVFLMKLNQSSTKIEIDDTDGSDCVIPDAEPEATFS